MAQPAPSVESVSYREAVGKLVAHAVGEDEAPAVFDQLIRMSEVVADYSLAGHSPMPIDPSGRLEGLDDDEFADWWPDSWVRELLWAVAADGVSAVVDWTSLMIHFAEQGRTFELRRLLALDLRDLSRTVAQVQPSDSTAAAASASPIRVVNWLTQRFLAPTPAEPSAGEGPDIVWRAWVDGHEVDAGQAFDALLQGAIARDRTVVVEFEHSPRRNVLLPIEAVDRSVLDSAYYCIDLIRCRGGWLTPTGEWTWERRDDDALDAAG